ncbi:hypothetical protein V6N13_091651 [Hibiscus sabdariffa]
MEAFEVYGKVLDVYVAYNNRRRLGMRSTEVSKPRPKLKDGASDAHQFDLRKVVGAKVVKGCSYRDAVFACDEISKVQPSIRSLDELAGQRVVPIAVDDKEKSWMKQCLIGQIVPMYDADFVQQVLISEGFKVSVSTWSGFVVVIMFEEVEQVDIFWDLKDSFLRSWLVDIDHVENFMNARKLRVWL